MASIVGDMVSGAANLLGKLLLDEMAMLFGLTDELKKLQTTMETIQDILADFSKVRVTSKVVKRWLHELEDAMYDADNILDLCRVEFDEHRSSVDDPSRERRFLGFIKRPRILKLPAAAHEIGVNMKELNQRLRDISQRHHELSEFVTRVLPQDQLVAPRRADNSFRRRESSSAYDTVGDEIEVAAWRLALELTNKEKDHLTTNGACAVVAIVGLGGIGKTTLAKKVFNHQKVQGDVFDRCVWVHVPQEHNEQSAIRLLRNMIREVGRDCGDKEEISELEPMLVGAVAGKKMLIVLDDVWSTGAWDQLLKEALGRCALGSRIIATTRNLEISRRMKAMHTHHVAKLNPEDGWALLKKQVLISSQDVRTVESMRDIGYKIVEQCNGLPLALKVIGGLLCTKGSSRFEWERILRRMMQANDLPPEIDKSIYLSYQDLPSTLKQCFLYCALIPKGDVIDMFSAVQYWIAENFVQSNQTSYLLEEIGEGYLKELVLRNLLESIVPEYYGDLMVSCQMSDVVRNFAQCMLKEDQNIHGGCNTSLDGVNNSKRCRRVSLHGCSAAESLWKERPLRSLFLTGCPKIELECLPRFIRVLNLEGSTFQHLPNSLYHLKHLRCLNLARTTIVEISSDIKYLKSLQCLNLRQCMELRQIPSSVVELHNLRDLDMCYSGVECIPKGLENLENLVYFGGSLSDGRFGAHEWSGLADLAALRNLKALGLNHLERTSISDSTSLIINQMDHLWFLNLHCASVVGSEEEMSKLEGVFSHLCPPACLNILTIDGYFGRQTPNWLSAGVALQGLDTLVLFDLPHCDNLPALGLLPNLKILNIENVPQVQCIGHEFFYRNEIANKKSFVAFPELKKFCFGNMHMWSEWHWDEAEPAMPKVENIFIENCSLLASLPDGLLQHALSLTKLVIRHCENITSIHGLVSVQTIIIRWCPRLQCINNLPKLLDITIQDSPELDIVENVDILQRVTLIDSDMNELPGWLTALIRSISKLNLYSNYELCNLAMRTYGDEKLECYFWENRRAG